MPPGVGYPWPVITSVIPAPVVRRAVRAAALASVPLLALASVPAHAEAGEGWSSPEPVDTTHMLLWFVVAPILLFVGIAVFAVLPALIRREPVLPRHGADEAQWIGGPGKGAHELPPAERADSGAGGASGSW